MSRRVETRQRGAIEVFPKEVLIIAPRIGEIFNALGSRMANSLGHRIGKRIEWGESRIYSSSDNLSRDTADCLKYKLKGSHEVEHPEWLCVEVKGKGDYKPDWELLGRIDDEIRQLARSDFQTPRVLVVHPVIADFLPSYYWGARGGKNALFSKAREGQAVYFETRRVMHPWESKLSAEII